MVVMEEPYTLKEASKILKVSLTSMYRFVTAGRLKTVRMGKKGIRVYKTDLENFLNGK
jgi:excisionase family DNA binding protein